MQTTWVNYLTPLLLRVCLDDLFLITSYFSAAVAKVLRRAQLWRSNSASDDGVGRGKNPVSYWGQTASLFPLSSHYSIYNLFSVTVAERNSNGAKDKDKTITPGNEKLFFMLTDSNICKLSCHIFLHTHFFAISQAYCIYIIIVF